MKARLALVTIVLIAIAVGVWAVSRQPTPLNVQIRLHSDPYPLSVGPSTLLVSLSDAEGAPVDGARIQVASQMMHAGSLSLTHTSTGALDGEYHVPIIWPMMGQWTVDVTAELPDERGTVREQFMLFIYAVPPFNTGDQTTYRSVSEINALVSADPERELWIVIPQGTQELIKTGQGDELIPAEIRLQANGRNILVIRNDDIADHTIGPFFVRSGETVRQQFTEAAIFEGTCSVRHSDDISIIVEA